MIFSSQTQENTELGGTAWEAKAVRTSIHHDENITAYNVARP